MARGKHYVIQDCVDDNDCDGYSFKCDAQVSLSLAGARRAAWTRFSEHYERIAGKAPSGEIRAEFANAMSRDDGERRYCIDASETCDITVEILEREAV